MDLLMGIDLGSTSLKAVVYDDAGVEQACARRPTRKFHPDDAHPEWTVWDPGDIWQETAGAIREALDVLGAGCEIRAVAVTGMGMDGLPLNADGDWLYPFISWHDMRTLPQYQWWLEKIGAARVFAIGGNPLWPINSALRILWMAENEPAIMERADKWLLIEDYVNFMLCGRRVTDHSMASCTLLFDQRTLSWSQEMLDCAGIDRALMCDVAPSGTVIGAVHDDASRATGLAAGTPVVLGGHDHLCGALPVGAFEPGVVFNITGTWECIMTPTLTPVLDDRLRQAGMTVQAHGAPQRHSVWGGNGAADILEWFVREFLSVPVTDAGSAPTPDWPQLMTLAEATPPGADGVMLLPHLAGASAPLVDPQSRGVFCGITTQTTAAHLLRAVIEGLDYQFRDVVTTLEAALTMNADRVLAVGGAVRNECWMQNKADVLGRPIEVPEIGQATPLGAAMLAGIGVGVYRDIDDAHQRVFRPGRVFRPQPERAAQYHQLFDKYRAIYPTVRPLLDVDGT